MVNDVEAQIESLFSRHNWTRSCRDILSLISDIRTDNIQLDLYLSHIGRFSTVANCNGFRVELDGRLGQGFFEFIGYDDRYLLSFSDFTLTKPVVSRYHDSAVLVFGIRSRGGGDVDELTYRKGLNTLIGGQSARYMNEQTLPAGKPLRVLSFYLPLHDDLSVFAMALPSVRKEIQQVRQQLLREDYFYSHFRDSRQAVRTLSDIILNPYQGQLRRDYTWLKIQELLCDYEQICTKSNAETGKNIYRFTHNDLRAIEKAKAMIETGYATKLLEEEIARDVGLSRTRLRVFFEKQYGETVHDFIVNRRINKAQRLLTDTDLPINEVAAAVGYRHASGFRQAFKKIVGVLPSEFSKRTAG